MDRPSFTVAIRELDHETLVLMFHFVTGMLSTYGQFQSMTPQEVYDYIVEKYNEEVGER